jgi:lipopolysaccharide export LptBFGC system permease protein LptF
MRTLHRYLLKQVLGTLVLTVGVFTAVLLMGNAMKEVLALVVQGQAPLAGVAKAFALLIPFVISFSLPMGLLTTMLLVFGRFSADQELIAARAGGVSLVSLVTPILLFSVALSGLSAFINMKVAPECRAAYKSLIYELATSNPATLLSEKTFVTEVPGHVIYIETLDRDPEVPNKWNLKNVMLNRIENNELIQRTRADRGEVEYFPKEKRYVFRLFDTKGSVRSDKLSLIFGGEPEESNSTTNAVVEAPAPSEGPEWMPWAGHEIVVPIDLAQMEKRIFKPKLSYLNFSQLRRELKRHGEIVRVDDDRKTAWAHYSTVKPPDLKPGMKLAITRAGRKVGDANATGGFTSEHLFVGILSGNIQVGDRIELDRTPLKVQLHRQVSFSLAAIAFTLVSIPLGIRAHRRETTAGVAMALVLILIYYSFIIFGQAKAHAPEFYPHYIVWIPLFLFQVIGAVMLWRANRAA